MSDKRDVVMDPRVREVFERGNRIREEKKKIDGRVAEFVNEMLVEFSGSEETIQHALEGAASRLLSQREKAKRSARTEEQKTDEDNDCDRGREEDQGVHRGRNGTRHRARSGITAGGSP